MTYTAHKSRSGLRTETFYCMSIVLGTGSNLSILQILFLSMTFFVTQRSLFIGNQIIKEEESLHYQHMNGILDQFTAGNPTLTD